MFEPILPKIAKFYVAASLPAGRQEKRPRKGLVKVTIYEDRRKLKYEDELLKAQEEAKKNRRGVWK